MDVKEAIQQRRAYRSLEPVSITKELIETLAESTQLAPSCFNNQPWHFIFVYHSEQLEKMKEVLSKGNEWAYDASLIIAVCAKEEDDCVIHDRIYYQFDTGLATSFLILQATELELIAHPIAGFSPKKTRDLLKIPEEYQVITLIIVGKHSEHMSSVLSEKQQEAEQKRPHRKPLKSFIHHNIFHQVEKHG